MFVGLVYVKIDSLCLSVFDHVVIQGWLLLFLFLAISSVRLKLYITVLKFRDRFQDSSEKQLWLLEFVNSLNFLEFMVQFYTLVFFVMDTNVLIVLSVVYCVNALHLSVTHQLKLVMSLLSFLFNCLFLVWCWVCHSLVCWKFLLYLNISIQFLEDQKMSFRKTDVHTSFFRMIIFEKKQRRIQFTQLLVVKLLSKSETSQFLHIKIILVKTSQGLVEIDNFIKNVKKVNRVMIGFSHQLLK